MASVPVPSPATYCSECGKPLEAGAKFCAEGGTAISAAPPERGTPSPSATLIPKSSEDEIATLERMVAEHPGDESYQKLLAVQLHDDAMKDWWKDPKDGKFSCTSVPQIRELIERDGQARHHLLKQSRFARLIGGMKQSQQPRAPAQRAAGRVDALLPVVVHVAIALPPALGPTPAQRSTVSGPTRK